MIDTLKRIKRAILTGDYAFSEKARIEMEADEITELDVVESILNAVAIYTRQFGLSVPIAVTPASCCTSSKAQT